MTIRDGEPTTAGYLHFHTALELYKKARLSGLRKTKKTVWLEEGKGG